MKISGNIKNSAVTSLNIAKTCQQGSITENIKDIFIKQNNNKESEKMLYYRQFDRLKSSKGFSEPEKYEKELIDKLRSKTAELLFPSESDYPFETVMWTENNITDKLLLEKSDTIENGNVEKVNMDEFFKDFLSDIDSNEERNKYNDLHIFLKQELKDPAIYRVGTMDSSGVLTGAIEMYFIGYIKTDKIAGIKTTSVET